MKVYEPHAVQREFHKSDARFRTLIAGRRGGKSIAGTIEALWHANNKPNSIGWIVAPTYVDLVDVNIAMIMEWLPQESIESWNKVEKRIELVNGAQMVFRSADDPVKLGRGRGLDWVWLDEASFFKHGQTAWESIYPALTDTHGKAWITTTPQGYDWVYETFYKPALEGNNDYAVWKFKTVENPYIDPEMVEKAKLEMNDQTFRQEYEASFEQFVGLVYPDFTREHIIDPKKLERDDLWFVGIDLGMTNPTAALLVAEDIYGVLYVVDEVYETGLIAKEVVDKVEVMLSRHGLTKSDVQLFVADPSGTSKRQDSPELSMFDQLRDEGRGLPVVPGNNTLGAGIDRVTQFIKEGRIKVFKNCVNTIREFEKYSWTKNRDSMGNRDEKPEKAFDHACLVGETQVLTTRGQKAIKNIIAGDMVLTPVGPRKILASMQTGANKEVFSVNGVCGTGDHMVPTLTGDKRLDSLRYGDIIYAWNTKGKDTVGTADITPRQVGAQAEENGPTLLSGKGNLVRFLGGLSCTMGTSIARTIQLKILSAFLPESMFNKVTPTRAFGKRIENILTKLETSQRSCTEALKESSGIVAMEGEHGKKGSRLSKRVVIVARNIQPRRFIRSFAVIGVKASRDVLAVLIMFQMFVSYAVARLLGVSTLGLKPVLVRVPEKCKVKRNVYNITVEGFHGFIANGVLVNNCDALRYIVMSRPEHFERIERDVYTGKPIDDVGTIDMTADDSVEQDVM